MERVVNIAKNHEEAERWDINQQISLTPTERQKIAKLLRERVFGKNAKDVKEVHKKNV